MVLDKRNIGLVDRYSAWSRVDSFSGPCAADATSWQRRERILIDESCATYT